jgi:hypothetical protein
MYLCRRLRQSVKPRGLDVLEEVPDGDGGVLGPAFTQVLAVGIDEAGAVFGTRSILSGWSARA